MHPTPPPRHRWEAAGALCLALVLAPSFAGAQQDDSKPPSEEELNQLVAPIALYPDALLAQILMASTYPLEVVQAARWVKAHPEMEGEALEGAMQEQSWDPSVKSLTAFAQVLAMMNDKLDWTTRLGNAFLADQKAVLEAAQVLRKKAKDEGNLESNSQQTVTDEPATSGSTTQTIIIEPAAPSVVYVPTYNPTVVYGVWGYPAYPPFYWYPPGYVVTASAVSFGAGLVVGAALWGNCNWGHADVDININRYNNFNRTRINNVNWQHDGSHRKGVPYGNRELQSRFGANQLQNTKARQSFRGRAERGQQQIARGQVDAFKGRNPSGSRDLAGRGGADKGLGGIQNKARDIGRSRTGSGSGRSIGKDSALSGLSHGSEALRHSARGFQSRGGLSSRSGGGLSGLRGGGHGGFGGRRRR